MSDRTYLDVIVEEEVAKVRYLPWQSEKAMGEAIARRAFEHSKERCETAAKAAIDECWSIRHGLYIDFKKVQPASATPPLPTPPPGFKHTDGLTRLFAEGGKWYWYGDHIRPQLAVESGGIGRPAFILEGPPPVWRFEHVGEFRHPMAGEWVMNAEGSPTVASKLVTDLQFWILRKVAP
jgi:hypothetical protein